MTSPFQNDSNIQSESLHLLSPSALSLSFYLQHGGSNVGIQCGVLPSFTKIAQEEDNFLKLSLRFKGFEISVACPWVAYGEDSCYSSCISKTSRSVLLLFFKESYLEAACICHKIGSLICTKWQQFDEYWLQKYFYIGCDALSLFVL